MTTQQFRLRPPYYPQFTGDPDKDRIINLRRKLKLSQGDLAIVLNCNRHTIADIEKGRKHIGDGLKNRIIELEQKHGVKPPSPSAKEDIPLKERIKRIRECLNLTRAALATLIGVSFVTVGRWETGATLKPERSYLILIRSLEKKIHPNKPLKSDTETKSGEKAEGCDFNQKNLFSDLAN